MKIAIYNLKGGVGKTVTTANLGHLYATQRTHHMPGSHRGQAPQVLMIDCDPQGNLTQFYKRYDQSAPCGMREKEIIGTDWPFLSLMPGNMDLYELERSYYESKTVDALADIGSGYDIVLIDCPPALNMLTINALSVADFIVIPVRLDAFSSQGLVELDTQLQDVLQINPALQLLGVLITHDERTTLSDEAEGLLRASFPVFDTKISRSRWIIDSTLMCKPLAELSMNIKPAWQYRKLANEIIKKVKE